MPYIKEDARNAIALSYDKEPNTVGELTYCLFALCKQYATKHATFQEWAEVLGSLEATKLELQRRYIGPYEETKLESNGDV